MCIRDSIGAVVEKLIERLTLQEYTNVQAGKLRYMQLILTRQSYSGGEGVTPAKGLVYRASKEKSLKKLRYIPFVSICRLL